jgi:alkanesulfonate monooxygenase SsuD/methylene tetrahydromethanopterin reductase-like flavin-dependent oxidoreductase (luciferase family)
VTATALDVRNMLRTYGKQATTARRLARYRRMLRAAGAEDEVTISREAKRRELVERVTSEIMENLIVTGSENPVVADIKEQIETEFGERFLYAYPPEEQDLQIYVLRDDAPPEELLGEHRAIFLQKLWQVALEKVDETML